MMDVMITREELHRVFGPRAFQSGLFYAHEKEGALRFELSLGGHRLDQFEQAYDRGREIVDHLFRDSERLVVVVAWWGLRHRSVVRSLRACGVRLTKPRATWTETCDDDDWDEGERTLVAFACEKEALHRLLWGAFAVDLGIRPKLACRLFLADPERGILAHPYDDRGMDVIGPNKGLLKELYDVFNPYLLDYDRERMDAYFLAREQHAG